METKIFNRKGVKLRKPLRRDLRNVRKFQDFINSLITEEAKILLNKKLSLKEERKWLEEMLENVKIHRKVFLVAECNNKIVGTTGIELNRGKKNHVGEFGITIRKDYRGIGLGKYLMGEILKLAKKELKPKPKIIRLSVFSTNKPAINLYKKYGFKKVGTIPKQVQCKGKLTSEVIMLLDI